MAQVPELQTVVETTDYVVQFWHPSLRMRTQVFRAETQTEARELAVGHVDALPDTRWSIASLMTVAESKKRRGL